MRRLALALALMALALPAAAQSPAAPGYDELLARAKRGDATVDFGALRLAFAATEQYHPYGGPEGADKDAMTKALDDPPDCTAAIAAADKIIDLVFVDIEAHRAEDFCHRRLGDTARADFHRSIAIGLLRSILRSGDGKSPATAYAVITVGEEYSLVRALGYERTSQSLVNVAGHQFDRLAVKNPRTGESTELYFNVDRPLAALAHELGGKR